MVTSAANLSGATRRLVPVTIPGPPELGRSVVVPSDAPTPAEWADAERYVIDPRLLGNQSSLTEMVEVLGRRYVNRVPSIFELAIDPALLSTPELTDAPPYDLGGQFTFLRERLAKLVWHNSYDARQDPPVWWWGRKAVARIGATEAGSADVTLGDGTTAWIDGGPRQPLDLEIVVIHSESVELGKSTRIPPESAPVDDLAPDQLEAVSHVVGPARIIAPAGSGKTRVLTSRISHLLEVRTIEPALLTAVAYNRRAANEMISRLPDGRRLNIRTVHSLGWEILRMAKPHLRLLDEREQRRRLEPITTAPPRPNTDVIGPYLEALGDVRIGLRHPSAVESERDDVPGFAETFRRYRDVLDRNGEADHDEQIYGAIEVLTSRPDIRTHWQTQCRHLLVDEFQDLTPAYLLLLRLLASPGLNVFGVGDDDQVIYGYAGADPSYLIDFDQLFPGASSHALEVNYRSPTPVVEQTATLLSYNSKRVNKTIRSAPDAEAGGFEVATHPGDQLGSIARDRVGSLLAGGAEPDSIAILARVNSSLLPVHVALAHDGIAFQSPISESVLDRTVLKATLAWIRIALDPYAMTRNDLYEAVRRPQRGITRLFGEILGRRRGPFSVNELASMGRQLDGRRRTRWDSFCEDIELAADNTASTAGLIDTLDAEVGLGRAASALDAGRSRADRSGQSDDLVALRRVAALGPGPADFEPWLREHLSRPGQPSGVVLSSVHRVKGLEWDHVIVFGADRGLMPHQLSEDVEEERRVFHVAITRGRQSVTVLADRAGPSRFLTELDGSAPRLPKPTKTKSRTTSVSDGLHVSLGDEITVTGGYTGVVDEILTTGVLIRLSETGATMAVPWGETIRKAGASGRIAPGTGPADSAVLERLKAWRLEQSRSQSVPAYVIFNDATLEALASLLPSTADALLSVPGIGPAKLDAYGDALLDLLVGD